MTDKSDLERLLELDRKYTHLPITKYDTELPTESENQEYHQLKDKIENELDNDNVKIAKAIIAKLEQKISILEKNQRTEQDKQNEQIVQRLKNHIENLKCYCDSLQYSPNPRKDNSFTAKEILGQLQSILGDKK